jgi:hypothetical protein
VSPGSPLLFPITQSLFARASSPKSFIYRFYAESLANPFISRIYANHRGCGVRIRQFNARPGLRPLRRACPDLVGMATLFLSAAWRLWVSLAALSATRFVCFQSFAASFQKTPGWGHLCDILASSASLRCHFVFWYAGPRRRP